MNRDDALRIDYLCELYLQAMEQLDFAALEKLWGLAAHDLNLEKAFHELNESLCEEIRQADDSQTQRQLGELVDQHLPSATRVPEPHSRITVADVMRELAQQPSQVKTPELAELITKLTDSSEPLPPELGLTPLTTWAQARFGSATPSFWRAFQQAALKLDFQQNAAPHYALAARSAPRQEG